MLALGQAGDDPLVADALAHQVPAVEATLARLGWRWAASSEPGFPARLATVSDPPLGVFVRGDLPTSHAVALVGARRATSYGREVGEYLGRELAAAGVAVVSGMARGVDASAHRGALAAGGPTVAVWGAGPDRVYPPEHGALAEEIAAHGCLVTEYPPGARPVPHHFPERNRIIAALADAIVVIEADEKSGALITARLALDEGRDVLAVPGSVFSRLSAGPNGLLRAGAAPVLAADDVLSVLGLPPRKGAPEGGESNVASLIPPGESVSVDRLAAVSGKPVAEVLQSLLVLELAGRVAREADGRYRRSHRGP
ncbi:MAG TPA: DNA-processing protein DprA [Thermoanaerobaculaceae bacterium]|nr:DNA-processing protein DprA [Thermoanaerobaculaceae bacterium]